MLAVVALRRLVRLQDYVYKKIDGVWSIVVLEWKLRLCFGGVLYGELRLGRVLKDYIPLRYGEKFKCITKDNQLKGNKIFDEKY